MSGSGLLAELGTAAQRPEATRRMTKLGYRDLDAFSPYPIEAVKGGVSLRRSPIALLMFGGGVLGAVLGYGLQWWTNGVDYPLNVGGFPAHSPPAFIPPTFETMALSSLRSPGSSASSTPSGLPRLWHPVFEVDGFERATVDWFFLVGRRGRCAVRRGP